jgi:hypothetical protein
MPFDYFIFKQFYFSGLPVIVLLTGYLALEEYPFQLLYGEI